MKMNWDTRLIKSSVYREGGEDGWPGWLPHGLMILKIGVHTQSNQDEYVD